LQSCDYKLWTGQIFDFGNKLLINLSSKHSVMEVISAWLKVLSSYCSDKNSTHSTQTTLIHTQPNVYKCDNHGIKSQINQKYAKMAWTYSNHAVSWTVQITP